MNEKGKCDSCKENEATVYFTEIDKNNKKHFKHLCDKCAKEKDPIAKSIPSLPDLLSALISKHGPEIAEMQKTICKKCGLSYFEFRQQGRLGCANDYTAFRKGLEQLIEKIHGSTRHVGKVPFHATENAAKKKQIAELQNELERAVRDEEFESAARLRDQIYELTEKSDVDK